MIVATKKSIKPTLVIHDNAVYLEPLRLSPAKFCLDKQKNGSPRGLVKGQCSSPTSRASSSLGDGGERESV